MEIIVKKPTPEELEALDVKQWGIWECAKSTFDWTYSDKETCYIYEGKVTVKTNKGKVSFQSGDLVVFLRVYPVHGKWKSRLEKYINSADIYPACWQE